MEETLKYNEIILPSEATMDVFETVPRRWGNSLGITIPGAIVKRKKLNAKTRIAVLILENDHPMKSLFGALPRTGRSTKEELDEIDREFEGRLPR